MSRRLLWILLLFVFFGGCRRAPVTAPPMIVSPTVSRPTMTTTVAPAVTPTRRITPAPGAALQAGDGPRLLRRAPAFTTLSERFPTLALTFDRPMDAGSVASALHMEPALPLALSWQDQTLQLVFQEPLQFGVTYNMTLDDSATDLDGLPLNHAYEWQHKLREPLRGANWPTASNHGAPLQLRFNYTIEPQSFAAAVVLTPTVDGLFEWNAAHTEVTFVPDDAFPPDTGFTVTFDQPLRDVQGLELPALRPIQFTTPPPILQTAPRGGAVHPSSTVEVLFDRPVDQAATEAAFSVVPAVAGTFSWSETRLRFHPHDPLAENTSYTVTVAPNMRDARGQPLLNEPLSWTFTTGASREVASFGQGPNAQVLDAAGRRAVHFVAQSTQATVQFDLYPLTLAQFLARYTSGFRGAAGWNGEEPPPISTDNLAALVSWRMELEGRQLQETQVPPQAPPGLYILNLSAGTLNDQLILALTHHTLAVKQAGQQLVAWVTDINGDAVAGAPVGVYARSGAQLAQGVSDARGVFRTTLPAYVEGGPPSLEPLVVVAGSDGDLAVAGLSPEWREGGYWGWWQPATAIDRYAAYLFSDRPIYKPGQTIFFKAIVRRDDDAMLSLIPTGTPLLVRLRDARDNVVQTLELTSSAMGSADGSFLLSDGAMLGVYHLELVVGGESHRQALKVEDYRKSDVEVMVNVGAERVVAGETLTVTVQARTYFGQPVAGAEVTLSSYRSIPNYGWMSGATGEIDWYADGDAGAQRSGQTDASGRFTTTVKVPDVDQNIAYYYGEASSTLHMVWALEATVADGSNQDVSSFAPLTVYSAGERVDLDTRGYLHEPDRPFTIGAAVSSIDGEPVAGRTLQLELRRWRPSTYAYDNVVQSGTMTSDEDGEARLQLTVEEPGYYQLFVGGEDERRLAIGRESWLFIYDQQVASSWFGRDSQLHIEADRDSYAPGDTARLLVESTFDGPALLTFQRGTTRREQLVTLTAPVTMVETPILPHDAPNIFVTVNAWQPQETVLPDEAYESIPDSRLRMATVNLSVPANDRRLALTITPNRQSYAPRDEATFTITVRDAAGNPAPGAEIAAALVDEAIFALSEDLAGSIYDGFYFERDDLVRSFNSMALTRYLFEPGRGGGGGGGLPPGGPRADFPDTAAWLPALITDANGRATVTVTLPDNLTTWRLTARAATGDTQVGEASVEVNTHQPIVVRPLMPRALTGGDTVQLSAMVYNNGQTALPLDVGLAQLGQPHLAIDPPFTHTLTLRPGATQIVGWTARAGAEGAARLQLTALPADEGATIYGDAVIVTLPVQPLAIADVQTQVGQFSGSLSTALSVPAAALEGSMVQVQLSRSIAGTLLEGLEYLTGFPYGCVEQTMSKALPNAVVGRALHSLGVSNPTLQADLPARIGASVQRLYGYQHDDGGWGWWYDDPSHDYQTAWVVYGLTLTAEAGYEVDGAVIARGAHWLEEQLPQMDPRTRAFALYSMALARDVVVRADQATLATLRESWEPEPAPVDFAALLREAQALAERPRGLDAFARAALALALYNLDDVDGARLLVDDLAGRAAVSDGGAHWPGEDYDGAYYQKTMASTTRSTALALSALSTIRPSHPLQQDVVRWLMAQRRQQGWGTTNETSFAILALTDHLLATSFDEAATATGYTVRLNGEIVASGGLGLGEPAVSLTLDRSQLRSGQNSLLLEQTGDIPLYYVIHSRALLPQAEIGAAGVPLTRRYLDPDTNQPLETITMGQLVLVELRLTLREEGSYLIVEDGLPGGLEALNERLNTTTHRAQTFAESPFVWEMLGYNHKEIFGDRVSFFITELGAGQHTFTYLARATHRGAFTAMPAEAYGMYNLALWGRSASDHFVVD